VAVASDDPLHRRLVRHHARILVGGLGRHALAELVVDLASLLVVDHAVLRRLGHRLSQRNHAGLARAVLRAECSHRALERIVLLLGRDRRLFVAVVPGRDPLLGALRQVRHYARRLLVSDVLLAVVTLLGNRFNLAIERGIHFVGGINLIDLAHVLNLATSNHYSLLLLTTSYA